MKPKLFLQAGKHGSMDEGGCVMEFAAWVAGEPHSDEPRCVSPVIGAFCRTFNDGVDDEFRQRLVPYAIACVGTNTGAKDDETRAWLATDWLVRVHLPAWMDLTPSLRARAAELRALPALTSSEITVAVQSVLESARQESAAASAAAARVAARADAAWAAARAAAAREAAWADAAREAAWAASRAAARAAAARAAAAREAAWAAAGDAAGAALTPTRDALRESALDLLDRMIAVGRREEPMVAERRAWVVGGVA